MSGIKSPAEEPGAKGSANGAAESFKQQRDGTGKQFDIAICGFGVRLAGGIRSAQEFWQVLTGHLGARGSASDAQNSGRLSEGHSAFDARFFKMTDDGRIDCDAYCRKLFEVTQECLEDACEVGHRGEKASVACYVAMPAQKDSEVKEKGNAWTARLVSRQFDFHGPRLVALNRPWLKQSRGCANRPYSSSVTIEAAESSASLVALDEACEAVRNGNAKAALVAGINLIATGATVDDVEEEAVIAVFIKPLSDAVRDGNPIQAVICAATSDSGDAAVIDVSFLLSLPTS